MLMMYSTALGIEQWARKTKALRLQEESLSAIRNVYMSSAASGIRFSNSRWMEYKAKTAFLRTYECRCSRHERHVGIRGSSSSASLAIF